MATVKQAKAPGSRAGRGPVKGRLRKERMSERATITQTVTRSKIQRATIQKYLDMDGAPKPDADRRYDYKAVLNWIDQNSERAGTANNVEFRKLKEAKLRIEAEEAAFDFGVKRGRYIEIAKMEPEVVAFSRQLTDDLRAKFEFELPDRYIGKSAIDCKLLNADAIDWVLKRLKQGTDKVIS